VLYERSPAGDHVARYATTGHYFYVLNDGNAVNFLHGILRPDHLSFAAAVQCRNSAADVRIGLFFHAEAGADPASGPFNAEPHECAKLAWYPLGMLPEPVMPYSALGVSLYLSGARYATLGW
jgi:hypothetical protein